MSRKIRKSDAKGFTLIEVVLVLAIGGLIFLLAFLAFQNASKNRRDTQRRADAGKVLAELDNAEADGYVIGAAGTPNAIDGVPKGFKGVYLGGDSFKGPGARGDNKYTLILSNTSVTPEANVTVAKEKMYVGLGYKCLGPNDFESANGSNAVIVLLEKGTACRDSE